jgi:hypothetical protein
MERGDRMSGMPVNDALKILSAGRELRGTIELDDYLLSWRAKFDGMRKLTIVLDELSLDEPIPCELTLEGQQALDETQPDDLLG